MLSALQSGAIHARYCRPRDDFAGGKAPTDVRAMWAAGVTSNEGHHIRLVQHQLLVCHGAVQGLAHVSHHAQPGTSTCSGQVNPQAMQTPPQTASSVASASVQIMTSMRACYVIAPICWEGEAADAQTARRSFPQGCAPCKSNKPTSWGRSRSAAAGWWARPAGRRWIGHWPSSGLRTCFRQVPYECSSPGCTSENGHQHEQGSTTGANRSIRRDVIPTHYHAWLACMPPAFRKGARTGNRWVCRRGCR